MNILIMTSRFGMGHYYAAEAIKEQLQLQRPGDNIIICDFMNMLLGKKARLMYDAYSALIARGCGIYNHIYKLCTEIENPQSARKASCGSIFMKAVKKAVQNTDADILISTYSGCNKHIGRYIEKYACDTPFITCITDIGIHGKWVDKNVDLYLAAAEETKRDLINIGIPENKIAVTGIPVRSGFCSPRASLAYDTKICAEYKDKSSFGFYDYAQGSCDPHLYGAKAHSSINPNACAGVYNVSEPCEDNGDKHLLVMGGGLGLLPKEKSFYDRLARINRLSTTVITGKNKALLNRFTGKYDNINFMPFTDDIENYIKNSDWLLTKPGGITTFEAVNACTPLILAKPALCQEAANSDFIGRNGLGVLLNTSFEEGIDTIERAVRDSKRQQAIKNNMRNMKRSFAPGALAHYISSFENEKKVRRECV